MKNAGHLSCVKEAINRMRTVVEIGGEMFVEISGEMLIRRQMHNDQMIKGRTFGTLW